MPIRFVLLSLLLLAPPVLAKPDATEIGVLPTPRQADITRWVAQLLSNSRFHYTPRQLDDELSAQIYTRYLDALDGERLFFLADDIARFEPWRHQLDDALRDRRLQPAFDIFNVYLQRVAERTRHARELLAEDEIALDGEEEYVYNRSELPWEQDRAGLDRIWRQRVTNDVLRLKLAGRELPAIRETLDKRYLTFERRTRELKAEDVFQTFMNAYAGAIEAHTSYMNARTSENFNIQMRLSLEGIGAVLQRADEFTVIRSVVPGGPAALSGQLKVGDRIVGVGQGREGPVVDVVGWRVDDVVELIRGPKNSWVRLDVLPAETGMDGKHVLVTLNRQKIKLEEQAAKQKIIEIPDGERTRKVGVITLPGFYEDFEGRRREEPDYRSASRDVARLLRELGAEGVEGVVLDLRNNGGGSLREAIELTGLFIDTGPVVQVRDASARVQVERDRSPGTLWDGPLAVLVNRASASASEIVAGAIQDHGRGLIIGEPTFGKGTVQNLVDLDMFVRNEAPGLGQLKLTVAQFFRISGSSTQRKGVVPDIAFPVTLDAEDYGESVYDNALPWTQINALEYDRLAEFAPLLPLLNARHAERAGADPEFRWWSEDVARYRAERKRDRVSLNLDARRAERDALEARRQQRLAERAELGDAAALAAELGGGDDGLQADERDIRSEVARENRDDERPDVLVRESAQILVDAIDLLRSDRKLAALVYPARTVTVD